MNLGSSLPSFNLPGIDSKDHGPEEFEKRKGVAVIFACNHCPHVHRYADRIKQITESYKAHIGFIAISSNDVVRYPDDSFENMKKFGPRLGFDSRYLFDESQQVAASFGAQRTPEVFLFDNSRKLVYHGTVDDNKDFPEAVTRHWFREAIEAVLTGNPVDVQETQAVGCTIKWKT